jgi:hypothetical protein
MTLATLWDTVQSWTLSAAIRGDIPGTEWVFPIIETCHVIALTLVVGSIALVDVRLLGFGRRNVAVTKITAEMLPLTWAAWSCAALFGTLMFISKAPTYAENFQFRMKFLLMTLAGINMAVFQFGAFKRVARWDTGEPPVAARMAGALSLGLWVGVVFFGRWVGFTT